MNCQMIALAAQYLNHDFKIDQIDHNNKDIKVVNKIVTVNQILLL